MRKDIPSPGQRSTPFGGSLNLLPMNYRISEKPIGDADLYGPLAHVAETTRKKIMAAGFGEMQMHIAHINKSIGYIKKTRQKRPDIQLGLDLGE